MLSASSHLQSLSHLSSCSPSPLLPTPLPAPPHFMFVWGPLAPPPQTPSHSASSAHMQLLTLQGSPWPPQSSGSSLSCFRHADGDVQVCVCSPARAPEVQTFKTYPVFRELCWDSSQAPCTEKCRASSRRQALVLAFLPPTCSALTH